MNTENLAKYGLTGVCIALILLIGVLFDKYDKLATNHSTQFTAAIIENTRVQQILIDVIENLEEAIKDLK